MPRTTPARRSGPRSRARWSALALAAGLGGAAPLAHADAVQTFYDRAVMVAADDRCHLFTADLASALAAAAAQAHGAALRSGARDVVLDQVEQRADARVGAAGCASPDIATAAGRVRSAFAGYAKLQSMSFPGDTAGWQAARASPQRYTVWKLSQTARFDGGGAVFGLAGRNGPSVLLAVANFPDDASPYTARLVLRDRSLAPEPYLNMIRASPGAVLPLPARMPPRAATSAFLPEARSGADPLLLPPGAREGVAFRFPRAASDALSRLDPREAVAIEFVFAGARGDITRTAYFEVGDFAAGRAFLAAAQR